MVLEAPRGGSSGGSRIKGAGVDRLDKDGRELGM